MREKVLNSESRYSQDSVLLLHIPRMGVHKTVEKDAPTLARRLGCPEDRGMVTGEQTEAHAD